MRTATELLGSAGERTIHEELERTLSEELQTRVGAELNVTVTIRPRNERVGEDHSEESFDEDKKDFDRE